MAVTLISKQLVLLSAIAELSTAAKLVENEELVIHAKASGTGAHTPIASTELQVDILTEALCNELRSSILEVMDRKIALLDSLGISISPDALAEIQNTSQSSGD